MIPSFQSQVFGRAVWKISSHIRETPLDIGNVSTKMKCSRPEHKPLEVLSRANSLGLVPRISYSLDEASQECQNFWLLRSKIFSCAV